ncbi:G-protein coupled receptor 64-like [Pundamilia nyererei]|uniref:G-protein coupled receptor 64-like n=3 Tax=Pundamilia nyererei TaxID=303518 RepID=A0A9Y3VT40_9CICH|nr:PREDICTED: G-protein coupled receptor 64-like [Pundamilia nyererei]
MLPMDVNHRRTLAAKLLFYGIFLSNHISEGVFTGPNGDCTPKNTLFISNETLTQQYFPSQTIYREVNGPKLCFNIQPNNSLADCCSENNFTCSLKVKGDGPGKYILNATEEILSKQDIVVMKKPQYDYSCMPSQVYNKSSPGFLYNINRCLNESSKSIRVNTDSCLDNETNTRVACKDVTETHYVIFDNKTCVLCKKPVLKSLDKEINYTLEKIPTSPDKAKDAMNVLSCLFKELGNASTAAVKMGNITGLIAKLPQENQTNMNFVFTKNSGVNSVEEENSNSLTGPFRLMKIPKEASKMAVEGNGSFLGILLFPEMHADDSSKYYLNSEIVGIEMGAKIQNLSQPIEIQYSNVDKKGANASCMSWDGNSTDANGKSLWITDGCQTVETNNSITCQCTHLTFFAILMSPTPANISTSDVNTLTYITSIGCGLSLFFLIVGLFMHVLVRKGKASEATKILMNLFVAMLILNLSFLTNESISNLGIKGACVAIAAVLHYGMLATFTWFFMQALHLYLSLRRICTEVKHYMLKICITGWVIPAVVVIALLASQKYNSININTNEGKAATMCWISDAGIHQGVNIGYYAVVFVFTLSVFILTVRQIVLMPKAGKAQDNSSIKSNTSTILSLFLLLGITWAFAFFSYGPLLIASYYIFTILNSFQGFFLFIYYYKSSKIIGDGKIHTQSSSTATSNTAVTSPYA